MGGFHKLPWRAYGNNKVIKTGPDIKPVYLWVRGLRIQPG